MNTRAIWIVAGLCATGCAADDNEAPLAPVPTTTTSSGGSGTGGAPGGGGPTGGGTATGGGGAGPTAPCIAAEGPGVDESEVYLDGVDEAEVTVTGGEDCARSYALATTADLREDGWEATPPNPRSFLEQPDQPVTRTGNTMFDALYALTLHEVREASVDAISNYAFDNGSPVSCPPGGCFETGLKWTYVWTRDTAYAVQLGLGLLDPQRSRNSLEFKLSEQRSGGGLEIVQDTGTGGSWPISTDRVVWALGAWELLAALDGTARSEFAASAFEAMKNTAERDRLVVFDPSDGLYRGEQSFLDWREQSYPEWVTTDPVQIGMSKSLSTNVGHLRLLEVTAALATEQNLTADASKYQGWADQLRESLVDGLWVEEDGMFATYRTTALDPSPARRYDLLGNALAVLAGVGSEAQRASVIASYPHLPKGPAVMWPSQQFVPVYHNRALWPFVTALWGKAARVTRNPAAITNVVHSLMRGTALNLSNMENFEMVTGEAWHADGPYSGPIINSTRQLWSVAGYVAMVHELIFGLELSQAGIRFAPFLPQTLRAELFAGMDRIALSRVPYRGKHVDVVLELADASAGDALVAGEVTLDGAPIGDAFTTGDDLEDGSTFVVSLVSAGASGSITALGQSEIDDYRHLFGPRTPIITGIGLDGAALQLSLDAAGENAADITFDVYRDGVPVAQGLAGTTTSWTDPASAATQASESHCYTVETTFTVSGWRSQRAKPFCWWGPGAERIATYDATSFGHVGGDITFGYGRTHLQNWGDAGHSLTVPSVTIAEAGTYAIQLVAGNGAAGTDTGITCSVKHVTIEQNGSPVAEGYVMMPHLGTWDAWRESSFVTATLSPGTYDIVIDEDSESFNMSELTHFETYGGLGGTAGRFNRVNVAEVKVLRRSL